MTHSDPPDGGSSRFAWTFVAVLAVALVAFGYAAGTGRSSVADNRARDPDEDRTPRRPVGLPLTDPTKTPAATRPVVPPDSREPSDDQRSELAKVEAEQAKLRRELAAETRQFATAFCAFNITTPQEDLARYARAEDLVRKYLERSTAANDKADVAYFTELYKGLLAESDAYTKRVVTPAFIESIQWRDLLADGSKWSRTTNVPGFGIRFENGVLRLDPPDADGQLQGVAGILDQPGDNLRHFVLDMEFAVEGTVTAYFHVSPPPGSPNNLQSVAYDLRTGADALTPGAKYTLTATYIGSDFVANVGGPGRTIAEYRTTASWAKRRRGGIAFVIPAGTRLTITRMRIKELR